MFWKACKIEKISLYDIMDRNFCTNWCEYSKIGTFYFNSKNILTSIGILEC